MSNAHKVIPGVTEDDLHRAAQAITEAIDAAGDSGTPPAERLAVQRATQAWLVSVIESLLARPAHYALDPASAWHSLFHDALLAELQRYGAQR